MLLLCFFLISYVTAAAYPVYSLTPADKANLVKYHNFVRANWGVPANLKWNEDIAANAAKWASGCKWEHSTAASRSSTTLDEYGTPIWSWGENMAQAGTTDPAATFPFATLASHVDAWKSEEKDWDCTKTEYYDFSTTPASSEDGCSKVLKADGSKPMCGHFTQVVWSTTTEIGCGLVDCPVGTAMQGYRSQFLVCQYNPGGNSAGSHPLDPVGGVWNDGFTKISDTFTKCPGNKAYYTTAAVSALTADDSGVANQDSTDHHSHAADGISVPMGAFVAVAVVCGLIVFLVILLVIAFIVMMQKRGNDMKSVSLL